MEICVAGFVAGFVARSVMRERVGVLAMSRVAEGGRRVERASWMA